MTNIEKEINELQKRILEYKSIIGELYEEIEFYENCIKGAELELEELQNK